MHCAEDASAPHGSAYLSWRIQPLQLGIALSKAKGRVSGSCHLRASTAQPARKRGGVGNANAAGCVELAVVRAGVDVAELLPRIAVVAASPVGDHLVGTVAVNDVVDLEEAGLRPALRGAAAAE